MALWRIGRTWPESTLKRYLADLKNRKVSFEDNPDLMTEAHGWTVDGNDCVIGTEQPGPPEPDGLFERARQGLINYDFSDPSIVEGHFDPQEPFVGRNMLLEIKALGFLHYLGGTRVHSVRETSTDTETVFGFRYDTLEGHIETGFEWFLLTKNHRNGNVRFKIEAHWQLGSFPNWWSRLGFFLVGQHYRKVWRDRAPERLRDLARKPVSKPTAEPGELAHRGDDTPRLTESPQSRVSVGR